MPDLPDELGAVLRAHANDAPVPPAASDALVHAVRRRQYARAGAFLSGTALAVVAVVGVAAAVVPTGARPITPAAPTSEPPQARPANACGAEMTTGLPVGPARTAPPITGTESTEPVPTSEATHEATESPSHEPTDAPRGDFEAGYGFHVTIPDGVEPRFGADSYEAPAGSSCVIVDNRIEMPHILRLTEEASGRVVWETSLIEASSSYLFEHDERLAPGRYRLVCRVHPLMRAAVVVR